MKAIFTIILLSILVLAGCSEPAETVEENPIQLPTPEVEYTISDFRETSPELQEPEGIEKEHYNEVGELVDTSTSKRLTMEEVQLHNKYYDCWFILDNRVYDATEFVDRYAATHSIRESCGFDATDMFTDRFLNSDDINATEAWYFLEEYEIGPLN